MSNVAIQVKRLARDSTDTDQVLVFGYALPLDKGYDQEKAEEAHMYVLGRLGRGDGLFVHVPTTDESQKVTFVNGQILSECLVSVTI
jgi:hypothetical protein